MKDLDDLTNGELCDLGVQLRKAVGIKAMVSKAKFYTDSLSITLKVIWGDSRNAPLFAPFE